jgi:RNA polymerase sigma factor (TIGR02999 family)
VGARHRRPALEFAGATSLRHKTFAFVRPKPMNDITRILSAIERDDPRASEELLPLVYREFRRLARRRLDREKPGQTLQATALVHEAYLRLVDGDQARRWDSRGHFLAAAAGAMRRILIEGARRKRAGKRGGGRVRVRLDGLDLAAEPDGVPADELLALDEALGRLAREDPAKAELVKLRYFAGLSVAEAAATLGISRATAARHWDYALVALQRTPRPGGGRGHPEEISATVRRATAFPRTWRRRGMVPRGGGLEDERTGGRRRRRRDLLRRPRV